MLTKYIYALQLWFIHIAKLITVNPGLCWLNQKVIWINLRGSIWSTSLQCYSVCPREGIWQNVFESTKCLMNLPPVSSDVERYLDTEHWMLDTRKHCCVKRQGTSWKYNSRLINFFYSFNVHILSHFLTLQKKKPPTHWMNTSKPSQMNLSCLGMFHLHVTNSQQLPQTLL